MGGGGGGAATAGACTGADLLVDQHQACRLHHRRPAGTVRDQKTGNLAWEGLYKKEVTNTERVRLENVPKAVDELLADLR
jgi:hypothetical protein